MKIFKKNSLKPPQIIVLFYLIAVIVSTLLLSLPFALKPGVHLKFIDILFIAVSGLSVTGLSPVSIVDTFSTTGIFILMFILQFGGIGIMTLGTFLWLLMKKKIGLKERQLIATDQNQSNLSGLVKLMRQILIIILLIELIGALILGTYFLTYFSTWEEAYLQGLFASVSATTNAGFDITGNSLIPFAHDYFVQIINIVLLTLGAIGFPVLIELKDFFLHRKDNKQSHHFSLYTKLTTVTFFLLMFGGTFLILLFDFNHYFANKSWHESLFYAFFQSSSTRNGGLATMDVSHFSRPTLLVLCLLMFIGASPSSVGGGVRTTTFAVNWLVIFSFARGRKNIKVFGRELHEDDIRKSFVVSFLAFFICFIAVIILSETEPFNMLEIMFEVSSAFGTTGLSMGITPDLSFTGKIIIIILMFIGRIGILSFIFIFNRGNKQESYRYPRERVIIG
ncbi:TrkH family potassium uptake protein [Neobacillus mesonae]|uniref:TrkH family potassium uptake protein n=1 Tax=Neobacillus mesonae TaxID=1193713 RepID=UPI002040CF5F|nr:TrkH family potassium uptake protein [Neobacillus mesonae]MCM3569149.1 TrkH family potassium uptake protein [Neobacillus mesonae]